MSVKKLSVKKIRALKGGGETLCTKSNIGKNGGKGTSAPGNYQECK